MIFQGKIELAEHDFLHVDQSLFLYNLSIFDIDNQ